jgi:ABC-2 type transport system permease protein
MRNMLLIFRRDYFGYVKAWGFWLSLAALPLFMLIGGLFASFAAQSSPTRYYAIVADDDRTADAITAQFDRDDREAIDQVREIAEQMNLPKADLESRLTAVRAARKFIQVPAPARSLDALRPFLLGEQLVDGPAGRKPLYAAFIVADGGKDIEYWSEDVSVDTLRRTAAAALKQSAQQDALVAAGLPAAFLDTTDKASAKILPRRIRSAAEQANGSSEVTMADRAPTIVAVVMAYFLWLMIFSIIQYLLMGTIEERSNKIFDTLLTSVRLPELLAGKLLAVFAVTSTMMLVWGSFSMFGSMVLASQVPDSGKLIAPFADAVMDPKLMLTALVSFVLGYLLYGAVFMALGALCDTIQEAQTLLSPMMLLLMLPMFAILIAFQDPGSPVVDAISWVPLFTPFLLILRMPQDPPLWEVVAQIGLMAVTTLIIVWLATKVYRAGAVNGAGVGDLGGFFKRMLGMKPKAM